MGNKIISVRVHAAIINGEIHRNCIVSYTPDDSTAAPMIVPFTTERHSTTAYNGIIIFAPEGYSLPRDIQGAGDASRGFTDLLRRLATIVPHVGDGPHSAISLPL